MRPGVRVIFLNMDTDFTPELRSHLLETEGVKIVAQLDEPAMLIQAMQQFRCDLIVISLDPQPELMLAVAQTAIAENPDLPIIAVSANTEGNLVLNAMRSGIREFLERPIDPELLDQAVGKIAGSRQQTAHQGKLYALLGSAGGIGSTLLATNLAIELTDILKKRNHADSVVLVDLDFRFGQVATLLDLQPQFTIADLCESHEQLDPQIINKAVQKHDSGLHVLARPQAFEQADVITAAHTVSVLNALQEMYDYVIVDGPHRFDPSARAVLDLADEAYLVIQLLVPSIRNTQRMLAAMKESGYHLSRISLVCNRFSKTMGQLTVQNAESTLGRSVTVTIPDDGKSCISAMNMGEPLMVNHAKKPARLAIREWAERLHDPAGAVEGARQSSKAQGLLGKIGIGASG